MIFLSPSQKNHPPKMTTLAQGAEAAGFFV